MVGLKFWQLYPPPVNKISSRCLEKQQTTILVGNTIGRDMISA